MHPLGQVFCAPAHVLVVWAGLLTMFPSTAMGQPAGLSDAPACAGAIRPTPAQTEGPFFKANSPERRSLASERHPGQRLTVMGYVLTPGCVPVAKARVDVWQADAAGRYDNRGFDLRGHVFTDDQGRYRFDTIVPGEYPGRTPHIHVRIDAAGHRPLTTQVYFPDARRNTRDGIFDAALLLKLEGGTGRFDFVLR